jgi:hypothetical protein
MAFNMLSNFCSQLCTKIQTSTSIYPADIQPDPPIQAESRDNNAEGSSPSKSKNKVVFLKGTTKFLATFVPTVAAQEGQLNFYSIQSVKYKNISAQPDEKWSSKSHDTSLGCSTTQPICDLATEDELPLAAATFASIKVGLFHEDWQCALKISTSVFGCPFDRGSGVNKGLMGVLYAGPWAQRACFGQPTLLKCQGAAYITGKHKGPSSEFAPRFANVAANSQVYLQPQWKPAFELHF